MKSTTVIDSNLKGILSGLKERDSRSLGRAISLVEDEDPLGEKLLVAIQPSTGRAYKVGFTGAPGSGKSSLIASLLPGLVKTGARIAILAVDPTSPFTGGAILGDRIRIQQAAAECGVYMRSMASRGSMGGLSEGVRGALKVLEAAGHDFLLLETVGAGQLQVDVVEIADTVVVVLVPESGDSIQGMKAGIIEIADIYVMNKADREGADRAKRDLSAALDLAHFHSDWIPPILLTDTISGKGIPELQAAIFDHKKFLEKSGELKKRREAHIRSELLALLRRKMLSAAQDHLDAMFSPAVLKSIADGKETPYRLVERALAAASRRKERA